MKTFRKIILVLLILVLVVGIVACDDPTRPDGHPGVSGGSEGGSGDGGNNGPDEHTHSYFYQRDVDYHKLVCTCGDILLTEAHEWGSNYARNCGTYKDCTVCGYQDTVIAPNHNYKYVAEFLNDKEGNVVSFSTLEKCTKCNEVGKAHYGLPSLPVNTTTVGTPFHSDEIGEQHISVKLSMTRDEEYGNRVLYRHMTKTYIMPIPDTDPNSVLYLQDNITNQYGRERTVDRLEYVSDLLPDEIYRENYAFKSIYLKTPDEIFHISTTQVSSFYERFFNFIRFVATLTDEGKESVLLSFEFDTSFIYQANGFVIRAKVTVDDPGDTTAKTIEELCSTPPNGNPYSYSDVFEMMLGTKFQMKYLTQEDSSTTLKAGDYVYCDINIGVPLADGCDNTAWATLLAKDEFGIALKMYDF